MVMLPLLLLPSRTRTPITISCHLIPENPTMEEEAAALVLLGGAVALAAKSLLLLEDGTNDSSDDDATAENILSFVNIARRRRNRGTRKRRQYKNYNHERARCAVEEDWLGPLPLFDDRQFERVFRITRTIAEHVLTECALVDPFFRATIDCIGKPSICPKVKLLMGLKCLCFAASPAAFVDYCQMSESTGRTSLKTLCQSVAHSDNLAGIYLRKMTRHDAKRVSQLHLNEHGVDGMLGSLDCMHVGWRLCPISWQGQYQGK
jgi:hypothetical protein